MPTACMGVACAFIKGKLYCINGLGSELKAISAVEIYDPETNKWVIPSKPPTPSYASGYAVQGGVFMIVGGRL